MMQSNNSDNSIPSWRPKVFISHTDRIPIDKYFTDLVVEQMKKENIDYWIDREHPFDMSAIQGSDGPAPSNPLFFHLCEAMASCDMFLFILSSDSVKREFCRLEFDPRVLFGPGSQVIESKGGMLVKLNDLDFDEISVVLSSIFDTDVFDMLKNDFNQFWKAFRVKYDRAEKVQTDNSWKNNPIFKAQKNIKVDTPKVSKKKHSAIILEGQRLVEMGIGFLKEKKFNEANECFSDASNIYGNLGDSVGLTDSLYGLHLANLGKGLQLYRAKQEVETIGLFVIDTHKMALQDIRYGMKCLRSCIQELEKMGEVELASEKEEAYSKALETLEKNGIVMKS